MPGFRKQAQDYILEYIEKIAPGGLNADLYRTKFDAMSDDDFDKMIEGIEQGTVQLAVVSPNLSSVRLSVDNNLKIAEEVGLELFQRVNMPADRSLPAYLTPIPYLIMHQPVRRQAQLQEKKISIPENNQSVDNLTGQPTGASKGSRISYPETQVLAALGLNAGLTEFLKYRGGDEKGFNAMNTMIARTGGVSLRAIEPYAGGVTSTKTLQAYLTGMQLKTTI